MVPGAAHQTTTKILILLYFDTLISIRTKAGTNIKFFPQSNRRRANCTNNFFCPTHFFAALIAPRAPRCWPPIASMGRTICADKQENVTPLREWQMRKNFGRKTGFFISAPSKQIEIIPLMNAVEIEEAISAIVGWSPPAMLPRHFQP